MNRYINFLLFILVFSSSEQVFSETSKKYFLEELTVDREFEFYNLILKNGDTIENRSLELNARNFEYYLRSELLKNDMFAERALVESEVYFLSIHIDKLLLRQSKRNKENISEIIFFGEVVCTDYKGEIAFQKLLHSEMHVNQINHKTFRSDVIKETYQFKSDFSKRLNDTFKTRVSHLLKTELKLINSTDNKTEADEIKIKNSNDSPIDTTSSIWSKKYDSSVIKILNGKDIYTGALLSGQGYFLCDYRSTLGQEIKVVLENEDTLSAAKLRVNKYWGIALCRFDPSANVNPQPLNKVSMDVGSAIYYRGYTSVPYLPVITGEGKIIGEINRRGRSLFLFNANYSDSMTGSVVQNKNGETIGILLGGVSNDNKPTAFMFVPLEMIFSLLNLSLENA